MALAGMSGWIASLGSYIDTVTGKYITDMVTTLASALIPVAAVLLTIWWIFLGWSVMRGQTTFSGVFWKTIKSTAIVTFALNAGLYNGELVSFAKGLRDDVAATFASAGAIDSDVSGGSIWKSIDDMSDAVTTVLNKASEDISFFNLPAVTALLLMDAGFLLLSVFCIWIAFVSQLYFTFFIGIGPLFILTLLFQPTQKFFDGWLSMVLNTIVTTWIGMFVISFALHISTEYATKLAAEWSLVNPVITALQYCTLCVVLALAVYQAPSWAASLTGGSSMQMGGAMARDASAMFRDVRGYGNKNSNSPNGGANQIAPVGTLRSSGQAAAYRAGNAIGSAVRLARYRVAALRGKS